MLPLLLIAAFAAAQPRPASRLREVVITPEQIFIRPGPVLRASSLDGAPPLPANGVAVTLHCRLSAWGRLAECQSDAETAEWAPYAIRRLRGYQIKSSAVPTRAEDQVSAVLTITLLPSDRAELTMSGEIDPNATLITMSGLTSDQASILYPARALRAEMEGLVELTCRVTETLEIMCPDGRLADRSPPAAAEERAILEPMFVFAAQQMLGQSRAAPTLTDGRSAAGHRFRTSVYFRVPDIHPPAR